MNELKILNYTIPDSQIVAGRLSIANSMIADELSADEATFEIYYKEPAKALANLFSKDDEKLYSEDDRALLAFADQGESLNPSAIPYGTPITYAHDGEIIGKFYTKTVRQTGTCRYTITAQSAMGLLITQEHNGGVYSVSAGDTIESIIDDIMSGLNIAYSVSQDIAGQYVAGWLPVASCRDNLQQLCFAFGISIMKDANGDLLFGFNMPDTPEATLLDSQIYVGGSKEYIAPATKVTVYEHAFYEVLTRSPIVVFDNTSETYATNLKVIFDNPVIPSTLTATGALTISARHANYAIVTGSGTLEAIEYTHTMKVLEQDTGVTSEEDKEIIYKDATLVNALNSEYCLLRAAEYYSHANEVNYDIVVQGERAGELVFYPDPFSDDLNSGLIKSLDIEISHTLKAAAKLTENWLPNFLGNNYTDFELITSGATWTPETDGTVRIFLVSGGYGGYGGSKGESGEVGHTGASGTSYASGSASLTAGGAGGPGGTGGAGGKVYAFDIFVTAGIPYTISIGTGGAGGASNGGAGDEGGATTITINGTTYSSALGATPTNGLLNSFNGDIYCQGGDTGLTGGAGGNGGTAESGEGGRGVSGESIVYNGITYTGGTGALGKRKRLHTESQYAGTWDVSGYEGGGGGGGAGYGSNGSNGSQGDGASANTLEGGDGGVGGASTLIPDITTELGKGGTGGFGGGGGGGGGAASGSVSGSSGSGYGFINSGNYWGARAGGNGSQGGIGGPGFIMIYKN